VYNVPYLERICKLKLERLDVPRLRFDILFVYKMLFGLVWLDFRMFFTLSPVDNTRWLCYKLLIPSSNTDIRKYFFSVRIVKVWNEVYELPASTDFSTLRRFSNSIYKYIWQILRWTVTVLIKMYMYYREMSMCISSIILYYCDIFIFYIAAILYLFAGGVVYNGLSYPLCSWYLYFVLLSLLCFNVTVVPWANE